MGSKALALILLTSMIASFAATPADAAKRRNRTPVVTESITVIDEFGRRRTRVTVRPRSFLDPGTETKGYTEHYTDYAFPPSNRYYMDRNDPKGSFVRMPMPDPYDIPGWPKF